MNRVSPTLALLTAILATPGSAQLQSSEAWPDTCQPRCALVATVSTDGGPQTGATAAPQTRIPRAGVPGDAFGTALLASVGSLAGAMGGYVAPMIFAPDDCQETCAGMWVTLPLGSILGAALGSALTGPDFGKSLQGSVVGFGAGFAAGLGAAAIDDGFGTVAFVLAHGVVTALIAHRE